jgi:hypothetical protein
MKLINENHQQKQFREDMEEAGYKVRTYSGYGRSGQITYGVTCPSAFSDTDGPTPVEAIRATDVPVATDQMGRDTIVFCTVYCYCNENDVESDDD